MRVLSAALRAHRQEAVRTRCCAALWALCEEAQEQAAAAEDGAVALVTDALAECGAVPAAAQQSTAALLRLTQDPAVRGGAVACGALEAAVQAMLAHPSDGLVQANGCSLVLQLAIARPAAEARAVDAGAIEAAVLALLQHPGQQEVLQEALAVLGGLLSLRYAQQRAAALGGIEGVVRRLPSRPHLSVPDAAGMRAIACWIIGGPLHFGRVWVCVDPFNATQ